MTGVCVCVCVYVCVCVCVCVSVIAQRSDATIESDDGASRTRV